MPKKRRRSNKQYETRQIQLLRWRFEKAKHEVDDHFKVGKLPLEIDMVVKQHGRNKAAHPLFEYFRRYNVIEVKTERDPLTVGDLLKLQAYTWLYMQKQELYSTAEITATILAHHLTPAVIKALPALGYRPMRQGIFRCDSLFSSYLISIEDLPDESAPEELQVFSNPARRRKIFLSCYGKAEKEPIIEVLVDLYESEVIKLMSNLNVRSESMPKFIKALGKGKVIATLLKDKEVPAQQKKQLLAALGEEEMFKALLAKVGRKRLEKMMAQTSRN